MKKLAAQDRSALIKLASGLKPGSPERVAILAGLTKQSGGDSNIPGKHILDNAKVYGDAKVYDDAEVSGDAHVFGNAEVFGDAMVWGDAKVYGNATLSGRVFVTGEAEVYGKANISGTARILGGDWDGSEGKITSGRWMAPGVPA